MRPIRWVLIATLLLGLVLIPLGPVARVLNEGFGDNPGFSSASEHWQRVSYLLIPLGVSLCRTGRTAAGDDRPAVSEDSQTCAPHYNPAGTMCSACPHLAPSFNGNTVSRVTGTVSTRTWVRVSTVGSSR